MCQLMCTFVELGYQNPQPSHREQERSFSFTRQGFNW